MSVLGWFFLMIHQSRLNKVRFFCCAIDEKWTIFAWIGNFRWRLYGFIVRGQGFSIGNIVGRRESRLTVE
ncbi:Uncharacterized protein ChrSV_3840 [Chromobacterium vaccinii]|nr:Uncharacterized protein ChrSW_3840 [Chromobacterium vaccinii]QND91297.1 Uncharacterized protein ChrSV_3840 [Chromobacterium vaccinii]